MQILTDLVEVLLCDSIRPYHKAKGMQVLVQGKQLPPGSQVLLRLRLNPADLLLQQLQISLRLLVSVHCREKYSERVEFIVACRPVTAASFPEYILTYNSCGLGSKK